MAKHVPIKVNTCSYIYPYHQNPKSVGAVCEYPQLVVIEMEDGIKLTYIAYGMMPELDDQGKEFKSIDIPRAFKNE